MTVVAERLRRVTIRLEESISNITMIGELLEQPLCMRQIDKFLFGYSRDRKGVVVNYHCVKVANTVHTSTGSGGNTDQFVAMVYEI
jgi:hypothetical protein